MHTIEDMLGEKNYSKCPLKKRPINYQFDETSVAVVATTADIKMCCSINSKTETAPKLTDYEQPENLSLKKRNNDHTNLISSASHDELINVSDCCEDEGVDVDHTDDDDMDLDDDEEMIDCVDIEENADEASNTTQAAALAAAAAVAAASAAVVVPTPTYPKYGLQPWSFHISPYTAEFYRTINHPHLAQQISPLRGDLLSPSSPSDSIGSLSPPPHYLHGRANSVSPPMRSEVIHRPIGVRQLAQSPQHTHRFMPYPLPAFPTHHPHQSAAAPAYPLSYHPHSPISPTYSDSSYYSMRSLTPESNCSSVPEDLSVKHCAALQKPPKSLAPRDVAERRDANRLSNSGSSSSGDRSANSTASSHTKQSANSSSSSSSPTTKKDKSAPPRYQCPDCQKSYSTFSGLTKHQQFHCPAAEGNQVKKSFSCKDCDKTYVSLGALKMHIRTHTLPCKCNICGKAFSRPWLLQGHIRTHTGEKPFSCQHCHRAFADRSNLRAHLQTHSDIKKYSCTNCSKTFSRMSLLTKHSEGGCPGGSAGTVSSSTSCSSAANEAAQHGLHNYPVYVEH